MKHTLWLNSAMVHIVKRNAKAKISILPPSISIQVSKNLSINIKYCGVINTPYPNFTLEVIESSTTYPFQFCKF